MVRKTSSTNSRSQTQSLNYSDGKEMKMVMQQMAADLDQVKVATQQTATDVNQEKRLSCNPIGVHFRVLPILSGNQLRECIYEWLSPPDPSTNHNIACGNHHKKIASWFFQGTIFQEWKSTGSLLWIHGKRLPTPPSNLTPSNIILYYSWLGKERFVVRGFLIISVRDD